MYELPYVGTASESALQTGLTRGNTYTFQDITMSTETLSIATFDIISELLDRADEAQSKYAKRMDRAKLQGDKINERLERIMQTLFATATNLGDNGSGGVGLASTAFTVSATNVDDIIRGVIEQIHTAKGTKQYLANGGFIEWRPSDWTFLMAFMQAQLPLGLVKSSLIDLEASKQEVTRGKIISPYYQPERLNKRTLEIVMR